MPTSRLVYGLSSAKRGDFCRGHRFLVCLCGASPEIFAQTREELPDSLCAGKALPAAIRQWRRPELLHCSLRIHNTSKI
jgi:hypothetical protein